MLETQLQWLLDLLSYLCDGEALVKEQVTNLYILKQALRHSNERNYTDHAHDSSCR